MKISRWMGWPSALCLSASVLMAQETNELEAIKKQLRQATESFEKALQEQRQLVDSLNKKVETLQQQMAGSNAPPKALAGVPPANTALPPAAPVTAWSPSQPITVGRAGGSYMNISFDALIDAGWSSDPDPSAKLQLGDHDPSKRGFSLRNAELALDGAVDPYFKGFASIVLKLDNHNETEIELEETYLQSTSLPANLQLKGGQFFANFGRQNPQHPHQWAFVDQPLILNRSFGPDGLRSIGGQLSWLAPTPFYTELFLGVFDGAGGTAHSFRNPGEDDGSGTSRFAGRATLDRHLRGPGDLLFTPRLASSFDLTDAQTLLVGASAAFAPNNTGGHQHTQIYGLDAFWKWKPAHAHAGFPFLSWQTEFLYRRFEAGADPLAPMPLPAETLRDYGFYSQLSWGFQPRWVAGLRGEWVNGNMGIYDADDIYRGERTRVAPNVTWHLSEFSKVRLQYNYDVGEYFGTAHSVWMQLEFLLGAHGAHKF